MNEREQETQPIQLNMATDQRNAGRDYHEYFVPGSIKLFLATSSQEILDERALDNSRLFRYRFGFELQRSGRQDILEIQKLGGYTDSEIRTLHRAGNLRVRSIEAKLVQNNTYPVIGVIQVILFSSLCLCLELQILFSKVPLWKQALGQVVVGFFWLGGVFVVHQLFIVGWQILRRSKLNTSE